MKPQILSRRKSVGLFRRISDNPHTNQSEIMQVICSICRNFPTDRAYYLHRNLDIHISLNIPTESFFLSEIPRKISLTRESDRQKYLRTAKSGFRQNSDDSHSVGFIKYKTFLLPSSSFILSLSLKSPRFSPQISLSHRRFSTKISQISSTIM